MKVINLFTLIAPFLTLSGCYSNSPNVIIKRDFDGNNIAVLNFTTHGSISSSFGKTAADRLTDAFFLINRYTVIDRAKVNEAQASLDIKSPELLSQDEIQKLGLKLKANYLVLGRINQISENELLSMESDVEKELNISIRIISVSSSDVIGVASLSDSYDNNVDKKINEMIDKIVKNM